MSITIHKCEFPKSVKTHQEVWKVYYFLKEKLGGKKAPKIQELIRELSENWDKHYSDYCIHNSFNIFNEPDEKVLVTRKNHLERDIIAIAKFKKYIYSLLEDPSIDRKKLKNLLQEYRN